MLLCAVAAILSISLPDFISNRNIRNKEKICYEFLLTRMTCKKGAVKRKLSFERADRIKGNSVLSESVGLLLFYILETNDRQQFEKQYEVVKNVFLASSGLLCWKIKLPSQRKEKCNASLDDIRIASALVLGYEKWGEQKYLDLALMLSENMLKKNVKGDFFVEAYCWNEPESVSDRVDLSYLDLYAMKLLLKYDNRWNKVLDKSKELLAGGIMSSGMFWDKYIIKYKEYSAGEKNLINNIICAIHLAQLGLPSGSVYEFLKKEWESNRKIWGSYEPETRKPSVGYESIAIYALTLRLALLKDDIEFAREVYEKILSWQITDESSYFYGAFADNEAHSFDNLQVLLALAELRRR